MYKNTFERSYYAKHLRATRKLLRDSEPLETPPTHGVDERSVHSAFAMLPVIVAGLVLCLIGGCQVAHAYTDEQIVRAIGKAENSKKFPYGVKSIKCQGNECRQICLNSVRNAKKRWQKAGNPGDFIVFMGRRYSPPNINPNWVGLVKFFLNKERST